MKVDVAILGAGTAGLSALHEVKKVTKNVVLIDPGELGTTCARIGCMPSKALIQVALDFHRRKILSKEGILGAGALTVDTRKVMSYVRALRDYFVSGVIKNLKESGVRVLAHPATFLDPHTLRVGQETIHAEKTIIATGSSSQIPEHWKSFSDQIVTSETIFELEELPRSLAVIGLGAIGIELGQALSRLGVEVVGIDRMKSIAGLTDPEINRSAHEILEKEFPLWLGEEARIEPGQNGLHVAAGGNTFQAEKILVSLGKKPNLGSLGLENLGVSLNDRGVPKFDPFTMQVGELPIFIAGDANSDRAVLHEAADEGRIAGFNSVREYSRCFKRRTPLRIVFSDPNIAVVGQPFAAFSGEKLSIGKVTFDDQGRSRLLSQNHGALRLYGESDTGILLGAEMIAPEGEHLAHLLSWAVQQELSCTQLLQMPFYHPVVEEGLSTALKDMAKQVNKPLTAMELAMCDGSITEGLY